MDYVYGDVLRPDLLRLIPADGKVIGSIGCGTGITEQTLMSNGREVHGVDVDPEAIALAQQRLTTARLITPSDRMPFEANSLDGLILADVIEHIPLAWEFLANCAKMVRPGGWVVISVPNMREVSVLWHFLLRGDWPEMPYGIFDKTHLQVMTRKRLKRWCEGAGLRIEKWFGNYHPSPRRGKLFRIADRLSLKLFHQWFLIQVQVVCRK